VLASLGGLGLTVLGIKVAALQVALDGFFSLGRCLDLLLFIVL